MQCFIRQNLLELEFTSDAHIYLLLETGMRGGISYFSQRYSETNNKYLKSYDPKQESKHYILGHK